MTDQILNDNELITDETKLQIAQHFLLSSPPGQFQEVLSDVKRLLPENLLSESLSAGMSRAYNLKHGKIVTSPSGNKVPLCAASELDPTHYIDPNNSKAFGIDHLSLTTTTDPRAGNTESSLEKEREAIQAALCTYISGKYLATDSGGGAFIKDNTIFVTICGEKPNLRNFWSGRFHSSWTVNMSSECAHISGEIKVYAHYFEDGNVQLQSCKPVGSTSFTYSSPTHLAELVVNHINTAETSLQEGLEQMYASMNDETFKAMRRLMPITKTKMEWNVNAVRMVQQIRK